jgi:phage terminase large subunit-like protein
MIDTHMWFDERAATAAERFFSRIIRHTKGAWAGKPFELQEWQRHQIVRPLFGWRRRDGSRRYRRAYIEIPRKQGKSTLASGVALLLLLGDNEPGAEIYSAAADRQQAAIVFEQARQFVEQSAHLSRETRVYRNHISVPSTNSIYRVLSADAYTKHGLNAHGIIFDELHAQPNRELWDVMATSMGARRQPMLVAITTAGYDRNSICWEQHEHARDVIADPMFDMESFAYISAATDEDDWTSPDTWRRANPSLGVTVSLDYLAGECARAIASPAYQNTFRRLYLNQWTQQDNRWIDMIHWDRCAGSIPDLTGRRCYGGLDLASTTDIAALVLAFPPQVDDAEPMYLMAWFWIPAAAMIERERRDRVPYTTWVRQSLVAATPGNVIDYDYIRQTINDLAGSYEIQEIAYDPWNATQLSLQLIDDGVQMVEMRQGFASLSSPSKELLRLLLSEKIAHGGNPVLRWMADNVTARQDPAGNIKPDKSQSTGRIDGIVAAVMAVGRAMTATAGVGKSIYDGQGVTLL